MKSNRQSNRLQALMFHPGRTPICHLSIVIYHLFCCLKYKDGDSSSTRLATPQVQGWQRLEYKVGNASSTRMATPQVQGRGCLKYKGSNASSTKGATSHLGANPDNIGEKKKKQIKEKNKR